MRVCRGNKSRAGGSGKGGTDDKGCDKRASDGLGAGWSATGDGDEHVGGRVDGLAPLSNDVVQTEVKLVEREHLGGLRDGLASGVLVGLGVVEFDAREDRVLEAHVHADDAEVERRVLVRFERRAAGKRERKRRSELEAVEGQAGVEGEMQREVCAQAEREMLTGRMLSSRERC
eukprot:2967716-Rhodomonas_salina.3